MDTEVINPSNSQSPQPKNLEPIRAEICDFSRLGNITYAELKILIKDPVLAGQNYTLAKDLAAILTLDKLEMSRMNRSFSVIPNDDAESFIRLATQPGTRLVVIKACERIGVNYEDRIVGFGRIYLDKDKIPDLDKIPEHLQEGDICRLDRLFVNEEGRQYFSEVNALDSIMQKVTELAAGRTIVVKLLTGPDEIGDTWLQAQKALISRGAQTTGDAEFERFTSANGKIIDALFTWGSLPPRSQDAIEKLTSRNLYLKSLEAWRQKRLSCLLPYIAPKGQNILVLSGENDAHALATMYPGNWITSVRPRPNSPIQKLKNLRTFEAESLDKIADSSADIIFCSSALPDLIGSARSEAKVNTDRIIALLAKKLKADGLLLFRETAAPENNRTIKLNLNTNDATHNLPSTARKFEIFLDLLEAKGHLPEGYIRKKGNYIEGNYFQHQVPLVLAYEFYYMVKYFKDWSWETDRRYCASTSNDRNASFRSQGLSQVFSIKENNNWTKKNIWKDHMYMTEVDGTPIAQPLGSQISIVKKPQDGKGACIVSSTIQKADSPSFVYSNGYTDNTGKQTLVSGRLNPTLDVIPVSGDKIVVKSLFPRPLSLIADPAIDGSTVSPEFMEQISQINEGPVNELVQLKHQALNILIKRTDIDSSEVISINDLPLRYFPYLGTSELKNFPDSPHLDEEVIAVFAEITPADRAAFQDISYSGFSSSGTVQAVERGRLLQSLVARDGRLERMAYELSYRNKLPLPLWLSDKPEIPKRFEGKIETENLLNFQARKQIKYDESTLTDVNMTVYEAEFNELDSKGEILTSVKREYFKPPVSTNLVSFIPVRLLANPSSKGKFDVVVGLEEKHSPVIQKHSVDSSGFTLAVPVIPLKKDTKQIESYLNQIVSDNYGVDIAATSRLGSPYFPSVGVLPAQVTPHISFISEVSNDTGRLHWFKLDELLEGRHKITCGQTLTAIFRLWHLFESQ